MNFDKLLFGLIKSIPSDDLMQFVFDLNYNLFDQKNERKQYSELALMIKTSQKIKEQNG